MNASQINVKRTASGTEKCNCCECGKERKAFGKHLPLLQYGYRNQMNGKTEWLEALVCSLECAQSQVASN